MEVVKTIGILRTNVLLFKTQYLAEFRSESFFVVNDLKFAYRYKLNYSLYSTSPNFHLQQILMVQSISVFLFLVFRRRVIFAMANKRTTYNGVSVNCNAHIKNKKYIKIYSDR